VTEEAIVGKASTAYRTAYLLPLDGPGPWTVTITRLTPDSTTVQEVNHPSFSGS
jgi:predicted phage tail protein